jgi:hypothetical protein
MELTYIFKNIDKFFLIWEWLECHLDLEVHIEAWTHKG